MHFYFAYGSNMNPERVRLRKMPFSGHCAGRLEDFEMRFNKRSTLVAGAASANVEAEPGQVVEGVLYELQDGAGIEAMDPFEGYPVRYDRRLLPIITKEATVEAWVYLATPAYIQPGLKPAAWYLNHLLAGKAFLSDSYYERLASTACLPDTEVEPV